MARLCRSRHPRRAGSPATTSGDFPPAAFSIAWRERCARRAACRARSCTRRGSSRAACGGAFAADASWTSPADMACSRMSCCCSTTRRPARVIVDPSSPPSRGDAARPARGDVAAARRSRARECGVARDVYVRGERCRRVEPRLWQPDRPRARPRRGGAARVAVLPCCHDVDTCDVGRLTGWVDAALAIDLERAVRLEQRGYRIWTQTIPASITSKNRLLVAEPSASAHGRSDRPRRRPVESPPPCSLVRSSRLPGVPCAIVASGAGARAVPSRHEVNVNVRSAVTEVGGSAAQGAWHGKRRVERAATSVLSHQG